MHNEPSNHIRTSQIVIRQHDKLFRGVSYVCQIARRIKNATHYLIRNEKKPNGKTFSHSDADKWLKTHNAALYKKLPSAISQRTTQIAGQEWSSFFAAIKQFDKRPDLFKSRPKQPRYANKATTAYIGRNGFRAKNGTVYFAGDVVPPVKTQYKFNQDWNAKIGDTVLREVRFVPKGNCYVIELNIGTVVIGHNKGWKQDINIGKRNNQKFVAIPHTILINQLRYKLEAMGITVIVREESYTSKASALDNDFIPTKGDGATPLFSGKRVKRGLYKASNGQLINADLNAALNILRKESGELIACRGLVNRPTVFYPIDSVSVRREMSMPLAA